MCTLLTRTQVQGRSERGRARKDGTLQQSDGRVHEGGFVREGAVFGQDEDEGGL